MARRQRSWHGQTMRNRSGATLTGLKATRKHSIPRIPMRWLVTDAARLPDPLAAVRKLRLGDGVIFRDYERVAPERRALAHALADICRRKGIVLLVAGPGPLPRLAGAAGRHCPSWLMPQRREAGLLVSAAVHGRADLRRAWRQHADLALISPVLPTRSHPTAQALGPLKARALATAARRLGLFPIALGGMDADRFRQIGSGFSGFAAIDALR